MHGGAFSYCAQSAGQYPQRHAGNFAPLADGYEPPAHQAGGTAPAASSPARQTAATSGTPGR